MTDSILQDLNFSFHRVIRLILLYRCTEKFFQKVKTKEAFAGESMANRRYLYFANLCDVAGAPDVAALFRSTAEGETGHAHGHMECLINGGAGEPGTGMPGTTPQEALEAGVGRRYSKVFRPSNISTLCIGFQSIACIGLA